MTRDTDQWLSAKDICRLLRISERTFYRLAFFRHRKIRVTGRAVRYRTSDVALFQHIRAA